MGYRNARREAVGLPALLRCRSKHGCDCRTVLCLHVDARWSFAPCC